MNTKSLHVHVDDLSPVYSHGIDTLIEKKIFRTKTEIVRAGLLLIFQTYLPSLIDTEIISKET